MPLPRKFRLGNGTNATFTPVETGCSFLPQRTGGASSDLVGEASSDTVVSLYARCFLQSGLRLQCSFLVFSCAINNRGVFCTLKLIFHLDFVYFLPLDMFLIPGLSVI